MGRASKLNQNSRDNRAYPPPVVTCPDDIAALKPGEKFIMGGREWIRGRDDDASR